MQESNKARADQNERLGLREELYQLLHDLVYILAVVTVIFVFFVRLVTVSGPSMTPTLLDRDYVAVLSNLFYRDVEAGM